MSRTLPRCGLTAVCVALAVSTVSADDFSRYREFTLGSSVAAVTSATRIAERDLKTVHSRPALVQEVTWQPRYMTGAPAADLGSINEMVFSFVDDRLFQMTVSYERSRTTGLTNADMIAALSERYGTPMAPPAAPRATSEALDTAAVIAEWRQTDAHIALRRTRYNDSFSLVITSLSLDAVARKARASAVAMDTREGAGARSGAGEEAGGRAAVRRGAGPNDQQTTLPAVTRTAINQGR